MEVKALARAVLRALPFILGLAVAAGAVAALLASSISVTYQATATMVLHPQDLSGSGRSIDSDRYVADQIAFADGTQVGREVADAYPAEEYSYTLVPQGGSNVVQVVGTASSPSTAVRVANSVTDVYLRQNQQAGRAELQRRIQALQTQLDGINGQVDELSRELQTLSLSDPTRNSVGARRASLQDTAQDLQTQQVTLRAQQALTDGGGSILQRATAASRSGTSRATAALAAGVGGLLLGVALVLLRERLQERVRSVDQASRASGLPVLAVVRRRRGPRGRQGASVPEGAISLQLRLQQLVGRDGARVLFVSPSAKDGRTTLLGDVGKAFATAGRAAVVVGTDLRHRDLLEAAAVGRLDDERGTLSDVLNGADVDVSATTLPNLFALPAGDLAAAAVRLDAPVLGSFLLQQREQGRVVLMDSPSANDFADSLALMVHADHVVVVARSDRTTSEELRRLCGNLTHAQAPLAGLVVLGAV